MTEEEMIKKANSLDILTLMKLVNISNSPIESKERFIRQAEWKRNIKIQKNEQTKVKE